MKSICPVIKMTSRMPVKCVYELPVIYTTSANIKRFEQQLSEYASNYKFIILAGMMTPLLYLLLRAAVGISMLTHGLVRIPKLTTFSKWMITNFDGSMLPASLVKPFSFALPVVEFAIGLFLVAGLLTTQALVAGCVVMLLLLFGTGMIENWDAIPSQLLHVAFFAVLLYFINYNKYAADAFIKRSIHPGVS